MLINLMYEIDDSINIITSSCTKITLCVTVVVEIPIYSPGTINPDNNLQFLVLTANIFHRVQCFVTLNFHGDLVGLNQRL